VLVRSPRVRGVVAVGRELRVEVGRGVGLLSWHALEDPPRLILELGQARAAPAPTPQAGSEPAAERSAAAAIVVDPGHGGLDTGATGGDLLEKDLTLTAGLRLAELLRAEGARVTLTRDSDQTVPLYVRCETAEQAAADYFLSLHFAAHGSPAAAGTTCFYFQRSHYYSEHGARLADHIGLEVASLGTTFNGSVGRNYAVLREPTATAVLVEPLFLGNPAEAALAGRPDFADRLAGAIVAGLAAYVARA
jgi:N-acetylmuramoyl-L-alanine amidase